MKGSRWYVGAMTAAAVVLCAWSIRSTGIDQLADQLTRVGSLLPIVLAFAGGRFLCQAAGWRLAIPQDERPSMSDAFNAVVAGEGAGYFAFGPVSREPVKAALVSHRTSQRVALAAAVTERFTYTMAAAVLTIAGLAVLTIRAGASVWIVAAGVPIPFVAIVIMRRGPSANPESQVSNPKSKPCRRWDLGFGIWGLGFSARLLALAAVQEVVNLVEAYVVLAWLGASPTIAAVVALEGGSRALNAAGQFIPGKLGVSEAASTMLAAGLNLGSAQGLTLALARRVRSVVWGATGLAFLTYRTAYGAVRSTAARGPALGYL
jgi:lysylphosphatidylglycerol synthase-like protein